jgi:hypothetical protein
LVGEDLNSIYDIRKLSKSEKQEFFRDKKVEDLLLLFMDEAYFKKISEVPSNKIRIIQQDSVLRKYKILEKDYIIEINLKQQKIIHNCQYWNFQCANRYKLCKHIGKILLLMYENDALKILKDMILKDWSLEIIQ